MASKIKQGTNNTDRLFTVRPRNAKSVTDKRGTPSSIQFHIPEDLKDNTSEYTKNITKDTGLVDAFNKAINKDGLGYINFIAQSASYTIQEKSQIMHTFGGREAVYFYGRAPVMVQLSGTIVDDIDNDQFADFLNMYLMFLRGSQAAKDYCYVTLKLNNAIFEGSFVNISVQQTADRDTDITFSAQFLAKTFTIISSDSVFKDGEGKYTSNLKVRDVDPSIKRETIAAIIAANERQATLLAEYDEFNTSNETYTINNPNTGYFEGIPSSFGKIPDLENLIGFSAADIASFFSRITDTIDQVTAPVTDLISQLDDFSRDVIGLIESVEDGFDSIINKVDSITRQVYGFGDTLDSLVLKVSNFPDSITSKVGSIGKKGGGTLPILGSPSISASNSASLILSTTNIGATRGTSLGDAAKISLGASKNQTSTLSSTSGSSDISVDDTAAVLVLGG
jgi:hypothetical protein